MEKNWNEGTLSLAPEREGYRMVAYGGSLWVFGGIGADSDNSVWRSADGGDWQLVTAMAAFPPRVRPQVAVHSANFAYEVVDISVVAPTAVVTISPYAPVPAAVARLRASNGTAPYRFDVAADAAGIFSVGETDGAVVAMTLPDFGVVATVSIRVRDATPVNSTVVAVTVFRGLPMAFSPESAEYVLSPYYAGAVLTLSATRGDGNYSYSQVSGGDVWTVNATTGAVSLVQALGAGISRVAVFGARDGTGAMAQFTLSVQFLAAGADASGFYVVGGDGETALNDVWYSADGASWRLLTATAPFAAREGHQAVSYNGSLWVVGGLLENSTLNYFNDVWRSADGANWDLVKATAGFFGAGAASGGFLWRQPLDDGGLVPEGL